MSAIESPRGKGDKGTLTVRSVRVCSTRVAARARATLAVKKPPNSGHAKSVLLYPTRLADFLSSVIFSYNSERYPCCVIDTADGVDEALPKFAWPKGKENAQTS